MEPSVELQQCLDLIVNPDNLITTVGYLAITVVTAVFAFTKKSLPSFVKDIFKGFANTFGKKK